MPRPAVPHPDLEGTLPYLVEAGSEACSWTTRCEYYEGWSPCGRNWTKAVIEPDNMMYPPDEWAVSVFCDEHANNGLQRYIADKAYRESTRRRLYAARS